MERQGYEREIVVRLFQLSNVLQSYIDLLLKDENLTAKQFFMMIVIGSHQNELNLGQISELIGTSHQNVKQICLKLEKSGYAELYKDQHDQRILRVRLTEKAAQFWKNRSENDDQTMRKMFSTLETDQLKALMQSLISILDETKQLKEDFMKGN
ncbi:hypothetical protein BK011_02835 [Tenericutes bacterium MZ-XQ]|jgi:DNA-binding MarR family transcriptional regulator|nr:hypothetical protein BK011_02835 [Tenericutes bacterium MZ-XQ]